MSRWCCPPAARTARIDKAATFALAHDIAGDAFIDVLVEDTHTCYLGDRSRRHEWGHGRGSCPACRLQADGFAKWKTQRKAAQ
jgi:7-cyano-7-deazaguanine synthase